MNEEDDGGHDCRVWGLDGVMRIVHYPPRKKRKPPRALRFADIAVGRQLERKPGKNAYRGLSLYYIVTDIWFDPVAGQDDPIRGKMIGIAQIKADGTIAKRKAAYPVRGLAPQAFFYASIDYIEQRKTFMAAGNEVVGIGYGRQIRARPKLPGSRL